MKLNQSLGRWLVATLAVFAGEAANAQYMPNAPESNLTPKSFALVDANGVDLAERTFNVGHSISIGDPKNGGMSYSVSYSSNGVWKFHQSVFAFVRWDVTQDPEVGYEYHAWALQFEGKTEELHPTETANVFTGDLASKMVWCNGANCVSSVTLADGTVLAFETSGISVSYTGTIYRVTTVTRPNGDTTYYHYTPNIAIQSITNNHGYQLRFNYSNPSAPNVPDPTSVVLFNMAVDPCNPSAASCPAFTKTWPKLTVERNAGSRVSAIVDASGSRTEYGYDAANQRVQTVNGPGTDDTSITYQYCGGNPPAGQCNAGGFSQYVGGYRVSTITRGGRTWTYTWDPALVIAANSERGVRVATSVGFTGYRTAVPPQAGYSPGTIYAFAPVMLAVTDQIGRVTRYEHIGQLNPKLSKVTFPEGNGFEYGYDARYNLTSVKRFAKTSSGQPKVTVQTITRGEGPTVWNCAQPAYCNKPILMRDAREYATRFQWDPTTGVLLSAENGLQGPDSSLTCYFGNNLCPKTEYGYTWLSAYYFNAAGQMAAGPAILMPTSSSQCEVISTCAASEKVVSTYGFGPSGTANNLNMRTMSVAKNGVAHSVAHTFDHVGNRTENDGARTDVADITKFYFDLNRRPTDVVFADGSATRTTYTPEGYEATKERGTSSGPGQFTAVEVTTNSYDAGGKLIRVTAPAGVTQMSYDGAARLTCTAVRMNPAVYGSLPADACTLHTAGANGPDRITRNVYNAAGEAITIQRAYGTSQQHNYASLAYSPNGKLDWVQDANGNRSDYTYDAYDRLAQLNYPAISVGANAANPNDFEHYDYDAADNRTGLKLRSGETIVSTFDALNRESTRDLPGGSTLDVYFAYDLFNRRVSARHGSPAGAGVVHEYDAWSNTTAEINYGRSLTFAYDPAGNRSKVTWPDTTYFEYTYDSANRMDQVRQNGMNSGAGILVDYAYDAIGRRSRIDRGNSTSTIYAYDAASRPSTLSQDVSSGGQDLTLGFSYNPASQILNRTFSNDAYRFNAVASNVSYTPDGLNRYSSIAGVVVSHDLRGNLTNDGTYAYTYDLENHLTRVDAAAGAPNQLVLSYDPLGRLRETISPMGSTQYQYAGNALVAEYQGASSTPLRRYVHGADGDDPIAWYEGGGLSDLRRFHTDHQTSVIATTDASGVAQMYSYGPYGEPGSTWDGARFRYAGQTTLPEVMLYYYKARVYSPRLGRFLQTDPIGYKDDYDLYTYVGNDPINRLDPSGTSCTTNLDKSKSCVVDQIKNADGSITMRKDFTPAQTKSLEKFEKAYTRAVNRLEATAKEGRASSVDGPGGSTKVEAGRTAKELSSANVTYDPAATDFMTGKPGELTVSTRALDGPHRLMGIGGLNRADLFMVVIAHEGLHAAYYWARNSWSGPNSKDWRIGHQEPFNKAALALLKQ